MAPLWVFKSRQVEKKLKKLGFVLARQRGSHKQYKHSRRQDDNRALPPRHRPFPASLPQVRKIAEDIGMTSDDLADI